MNTIQTRIIISGLFFLFIFLSGFLLSRAGKPHNPVFFNIHKLIGLATGVILIITVVQINHIGGLETIQITVIIFTALMFITLVAAGGLIGIEADGKLQNASQSLLTTVATIHRVFPYLSLLSAAVTFYLLIFSRS